MPSVTRRQAEKRGVRCDSNEHSSTVHGTLFIQSRWCARDFAIVNVDGTESGHSRTVRCASWVPRKPRMATTLLRRLPKWAGAMAMWASPVTRSSPSFSGLSPSSSHRHSRRLHPGEDAATCIASNSCAEVYIFNMSNFNLIATRIVQGNHGVEDFAQMNRRTIGGLMNA
jgi:hypothetical protein